jgi:N-acetylglucosaminyldiphosphoundecaprenol N-acetyl-beta-D-mannosaminyltransferase
MSRNVATILGVRINSTSASQVLGFVAQSIRDKQTPRLVFTPNAEFLVAAFRDKEFAQILNQSDINVPDGSGLILLSSLTGQKIAERVSGADLVAALLTVGSRGGWRVGVVGARRGERKESATLFQRLKEKYPGVDFINLDDPEVSIKDLGFEIVLACQGMQKQERWILDNKNKIKANVFMGVGGSLDFLTGFTKRAPVWIQNVGLEWLWRGLTKPGHWGRVWTAVAVFPWLVLRERFRIYKV